MERVCLVGQYPTRDWGGGGGRSGASGCMIVLGIYALIDEVGLWYGMERM